MKPLRQPKKKEKIYAIIDLDKCTNLDFETKDIVYTATKQRLLKWLREVKILKNITLLKKKDGYWLCIETSTGMQAMLNLNNLKGRLIRQAFLDWAEENYETL